MIYCTKLAEGGLGGNKGPRERPIDLGLGYCVDWDGGVWGVTKVHGNMYYTK